jgi:hypothetical protein
MFCFVFLVAAIGCQPVSKVETMPASPPSPTPIQQSTETPALRVSPTDQVEMQTPLSNQPTPRDPVENEIEIPWDDAHMPIFLEVIQTTSMGEKSVQSPTFGVGPAIYFYNPENNVLMLHPTITQKSKTEVLVGVTSILQTPGQVFEKREIVQFPSAQPASIQIAAFNKNNGSIELVYKNENFSLSPGESRTFKQVGDGSNTLTVIASISNHGHLVDIQPVSFDGSWR